MRYIYLVAACLLSGCSTQTLHIFESGLDDTTRQNLMRELAQREVNFRFTSLPVPEKYDSARLNIAPMTSGERWLGEVEAAVKAVGFESLTTSEFNMEGHRYTPGNAGLYLVKNRAVQLLPNLLFSHQCDDALQLQLNQRGSWEQVGSHYQGRWRYEGGHLTLTWRENDNKYPYQQVYSEREHSVQTLQGPKPAKTFTRIQLAKRPVPIFNCDLQVIFAN
ncbi:hypothetical protein [Pseudoalteromonas peptidolytica]|uniref:Lipoprotein n=1 Tax=Pseudoalteromonas peptidolytica F12-50-A1 TaxID=1315280 RepID=A0A8I0T580_9GAMM|nr:hypothetical protein [Pseudoalteromonas peptidolytica]MBE0348196.1 hypothetical protein [Pseudoalteromonas peptidolytica F12-50-A1]NLR15467.1 hypothetical protein [Pseudoalteromonas peptidolytica]